MSDIASTPGNRESGVALVQPAGMLLIPAGTFLMGSENGSEAERPVHEVCLDDFYMDEAPAINQQFDEFVQETSYQTDAERVGAAWGYRDGMHSLIDGLCWRDYAVSGREEHPVVLVSWHDAHAFAEWAGKRLPTEAQWERAARGGLVGEPYPWGNQPPDGTQCDFARPSSEFPGTAPVKSFGPNGYGLYDMFGNVWQWCANPYSLYGCSEAPSNGALCGIKHTSCSSGWSLECDPAISPEVL